MDVEVAEGFGSGPGPERPGPGAGSGLRLLGWTAAAVALLVLGYLVLSHQSAPGSAAAATSTASTAPDGGQSQASYQQDPNLEHPWESPDALNYLNVGDICPVVTDGHSSMRVSFQLTNPTPVTVVLVTIRPQLPMGGLKPAGPVTAGGTCAHPGRAKAEGPFAPGHTRLYTMTLRLPKTCPQPLPVGAAFQVWPDDSGKPEQTIIFDDLGSVNFDSCPARSR